MARTDLLYLPNNVTDLHNQLDQHPSWDQRCRSDPSLHHRFVGLAERYALPPRLARVIPRILEYSKSRRGKDIRLGSRRSSPATSNECVLYGSARWSLRGFLMA